jgi:hypothetical protein
MRPCIKHRAWARLQHRSRVRVSATNRSYVPSQRTAIEGKDTIEFRSCSRKLCFPQLGLKVSELSDWRRRSRKLDSSIRDAQATILQIWPQKAVLHILLYNPELFESTAVVQNDKPQIQASEDKIVNTWQLTAFGGAWEVPEQPPCKDDSSGTQFVQIGASWPRRVDHSEWRVARARGLHALGQNGACCIPFVF